MKINRIWAMPNSETFKIKPIRELIEKYIKMFPGKIIDPFVRNSIFKDQCHLTNDLNPDITADSNINALDFLKGIEDRSVDIVLFDPPYSPRQVMECYNGIGKQVFKRDTQMDFWSDNKDQIKRILRPGGISISCGWNSMGMAKSRGFEIVEILMVPHGGHKNDTIVTVDQKLCV
jgi:hypothetical protein